MKCSECIDKLNEFCDGELPAFDAQALEDHVAGCSECAAKFASLRALRAATAALPRAIAPRRDLWPGITAQLHGTTATEWLDESHAGETRTDGTARLSRDVGVNAESVRIGASSSRPRRMFAWVPPLAIAASLVVIATVANRHAAERLGGTGWQVASLAGAPQVNALAVKSSGQLRPGQWLVTDSVSRAKVSVGAIGEVSVEPNSRVRLVEAAPTDHRVELARGTLSALIWAPPRLFFVDTPSGTAVDLGCAYTLTVDDRGGGELRVTSGYVALEYGGRESIVPAGLSCLTRPGIGPGTPFRAGAPPALRHALEQFDFARSAAPSALRRIVDEARAEDGVTLWHLLARSPEKERAAVYDALARDHPPPSQVTRSDVLALDPTGLRAWAIDLGLNPLR